MGPLIPPVMVHDDFITHDVGTLVFPPSYILNTKVMEEYKMSKVRRCGFNEAREMGERVKFIRDEGPPATCLKCIALEGSDD